MFLFATCQHDRVLVCTFVALRVLFGAMGIWACWQYFGWSVPVGAALIGGCEGLHKLWMYQTWLKREPKP